MISSNFFWEKIEKYDQQKEFSNIKWTRKSDMEGF